MSPLEIGSKAPDFIVDPSSSRTFHDLLNERAAPALVYFYPMDFSPACTAQACMIRNAVKTTHADNEPLIIGVSPQGGALHHAFQSFLGLNQRLVADRDRSIARSYGVLGRMGVYRRVSFCISPDAVIEDRATGNLVITRHKRLVESFLAKSAGHE